MSRSRLIHDRRVAVDTPDPAVIFMIMGYGHDVRVGVYRFKLNASAQRLWPIGIQQNACPVVGLDQEAGMTEIIELDLTPLLPSVR